MNLHTPHSGQVALIMVLIMTVVSAVAVSLASRSTVETRIQQMNLENTEALLTAQAGLEAAISQNTALEGSLGTGKNYNVERGDAGTTSITTEKINSGESFEINLIDGSVTEVKIYWKSATIGGVPAIFVSDVRSSQSVDYAYDSTGSNGFTEVVSGGVFEGVNYSYVTPVPISISTTESKKLRIIVLGTPAFIGIEPVGGQLSVQSTNFRSIADISSATQGVVKYGIEYKESKADQLPSVFDYVLFSGGSIVQ